jgi:hypothetical protein
LTIENYTLIHIYRIDVTLSVALLQQPSEQGRMTKTGITSLEAILPIMSLHVPDSFKNIAEKTGMFSHVSIEYMTSPCGKPFCEVTLRRI